MELLQIENGSGRVIIALEASDCVTLARISQIADDYLDRPEDRPLANAAQMYIASLRAFAMSAVGICYVPPSKEHDLLEDLANLGLGELLPVRN